MRKYGFPILLVLAFFASVLLHSPLTMFTTILSAFIVLQYFDVVHQKLSGGSMRTLIGLMMAMSALAGMAIGMAIAVEPVSSIGMLLGTAFWYCVEVCSA